MAFDKKFIDYGVVSIQSISNGVGRVKVHYSSTGYEYLNNPQDVVSARWAGNCIITEHKDGRTKRWESLTSSRYI